MDESKAQFLILVQGEHWHSEHCLLPFILSPGCHTAMVFLHHARCSFSMPEVVILHLLRLIIIAYLGHSILRSPSLLLSKHKSSFNILYVALGEIIILQVPPTRDYLFSFLKTSSIYLMNTWDCNKKRKSL